MPESHHSGTRTHIDPHYEVTLQVLRDRIAAVDGLDSDEMTQFNGYADKLEREFMRLEDEATALRTQNERLANENKQLVEKASSEGKFEVNSTVVKHYEDIIQQLRTDLENLRNRRNADPGVHPGIQMLLWCPLCHARHIDKGEFATKPHHTHACQECGHCWRPAVADTVGVQFLPGFKDADVESEEEER